MQLRKGFTLRPLGNEYILLAEGAETVNFNKMLTLNESAAYLYRSVEGKDFDATTLCELLLAEYEVDEATALRDAEAVVASWQEIGIVE